MVNHLLIDISSHIIKTYFYKIDVNCFNKILACNLKIECSLQGEACMGEGQMVIGRNSSIRTKIQTLQVNNNYSKHN